MYPMYRTIQKSPHMRAHAYGSAQNLVQTARSLFYLGQRLFRPEQKRHTSAVHVSRKATDMPTELGFRGDRDPFGVPLLKSRRRYILRDREKTPEERMLPGGSECSGAARCALGAELGWRAPRCDGLGFSLYRW